MDREALLLTARQCQELARHFGDRQNRTTELKPEEAQQIVTRALNAGNLLEQTARQLAAETPKE